MGLDSWYIRLSLHFVNYILCAILQNFLNFSLTDRGTELLLAGSRDDSFVTKGSLGMRAHPRGLNYKLNLLMHEKIRYLTSELFEVAYNKQIRQSNIIMTIFLNAL